jgi:Spy/CpxP family protein refolding chaperone
MQQMKAIAVMLLLGAVPALNAQGKPPMDTSWVAMMQRMEAHAKKELGMTDDQAAKFHATHERFGPQLRDLMKKGRGIHEALRGQLQPGVAANTDSVKKLLDAWYQNRAAHLQLERDFDKDVAAYLTPVQRARLTMMHEHMMMRGRMRGHGEGRDDMDGMGGHMGDPHGGDMHHQGEGGGPPPRS